MLFTVGKLLIGLYLANSTISSSYCAVGGLIIGLLSVYCSAQIFLLGAECTGACAHRPPPNPVELVKAVPNVAIHERLSRLSVLFGYEWLAMREGRSGRSLGAAPLTVVMF
jgi:uncharacterized BrkB/YihY/UPF0761 family membrane protein